LPCPRKPAAWSGSASNCSRASLSCGDLVRSLDLLAGLIAERSDRTPDDPKVRTVAGALVGVVVSVLPLGADDAGGTFDRSSRARLDAAFSHLEAVAAVTSIRPDDVSLFRRQGERMRARQGCLGLGVADTDAHCSLWSLDETELVAVGVTEGELSSAVRRIEQRLDHVGALTDPGPPCIDIADLEVEACAYGRHRLVLPESELRGAQRAVNVCRRIEWPMALRAHSEQLVIPLGSPRPGRAH
jgi:hypothetical protein